MSMPEDYRHKFIAGLHNALSGHTTDDVDEAVKFSEQSKTKCVGITIETRPDYCLKPHLSQMLRYGCTRLEIGVQSVYEVSLMLLNQTPPLTSRTLPETRIEVTPSELYPSRSTWPRTPDTRLSRT